MTIQTIVDEVINEWEKMKLKELIKEGVKGAERDSRLVPSQATLEAIRLAIQKRDQEWKDAMDHVDCSINDYGYFVDKKQLLARMEEK